MADKHKDWIPRSEEDFIVFCTRWLAALDDTAKIAAYGWKPEEVAAVRQALLDYTAARAAFEAVDSSYNRLAKNEAKAAAIAAVRLFANTSIRFNNKVPDEDRLAYNIHPMDTTRTPSPAPHTYPEAEADTSIIRQITVHFWDSASKKRGKPHGVHGAEIRWAMLDARPASVEDLIHSDFDTASPLTLTFDEPDRGKRIYFTLRWKSLTNLKGPYSEIYSAIVP